MSTEAQLKAISNSELASGNQIPALKHRTVNNAIIEEMYDAQSRGDVLAGVQTAVSIASGDQVLVIRSGQAYLLDSSEFGFVDALADLTDVSVPTPSNDQVLAYNTSNSKWEAKDVNTLTSVVNISGAATTNALTKFTGTSSIGNSILSDNGTTVTIGGNLSVDNNLTVGTINSGTSSDFVKGDGSLDSTDYQGQIDAEEAARIAADGVLQTNIDDEESARIAADSGLQSQITTNDGNITTNASNISANAADIATNTSDIADNTSDITTNQNNIAANTSDIATNTSDIATNTSNISTNTSNIATNTSNIATNTSNISTNTSNIATNTSDITDLQDDKQDISEKDQANGYAPLDSGAKIPLANLPDSVLGQVTYQGTWNASTNTPTLANPPASTTKGDYYVVNTGGTQFSIEFQVGDWIISNGSAWEKVDNTDAVTSVFGRLGNVVANAGDYAAFYPPVSRTISAGTGLTGGGDLSANRTISHADTSSQPSVNNSGLTFIQDVTLDGFGHVTDLNSATVTLPTVNNSTITLSAGTGLSGGGDFTLNQGSAETIAFNNTDRGSSQNIFKNVAVGGQSTIVADSNNDTLTLAAGTNVTITTNASTDTIIINSTDQFTGTVTSVATGSGLTGGTITTSGTISHADTSSQGSVNNSGGTVIQDVTLDGFGHVTGLSSINLDSRYVQSLTDTLDSVTDRGNTTTNAITVGDTTVNGKLEIDVTAITGREDILFGTISDSTPSKFGISNGTGVTGEFVPSIYGYQSVDRFALQFRGLGDSSYDSVTSEPLIVFSVSNTSSSTDPLNGTLTPITQRDAFLFQGVTFDYMRIKANGNILLSPTNGNIGIGESDPDHKLHVVSNEQCPALFESTISGGGIALMDSTTTNDEQVGIGAFGNNLCFRAGGDADGNMRLHSTGNLTIGGNLSDSGNRLDVRGDATINGTLDTTGNIAVTSSGVDQGRTLSLQGRNGASEIYQFNLVADGENAAAKFMVGVGGGAATERMRIDSAGNVGIGGSITSLSDTDEISIFAGTTVADNRARIELYGPSHATLADQAFIRGEQIVFTSDAASTERMRIDSSGNVGINYSNGAIHTYGSGNYAGKTVIKASTTNALALLNSSTGGSAQVAINFTNEFAANQYNYLARIIAEPTQAWTTNAATRDSDLTFFTTLNGATSERMRIDSAGNVGIGTGTPSAKLDVDGNMEAYKGAFFVESGDALDITGNILIHGGTTTTDFTITDGTSTEPALFTFNKPFTAASTAILFRQNNITKGFISYTGTSTTYSTTSDYRLKENLEPMQGALDRVDALNPLRFNFIGDDKVVDGFLAHEAAEVVPEAVTGEKDAILEEEYEVEPAVYDEIVHPAQEEVLDDDGNVVEEAKEEWIEKVLVSEAVMGTRLVPEYQGIDQSKLVPLLVGAIQELRAEIETLKQQINGQ